MVALDVAGFIFGTRGTNVGLLYSLVVTSSIISGCCNFIALSFLIYRCWIVWNRNIRVVVIPLILVVTFLALWIPGSVLLYAPVPNWVYPINLASFATSVTTNALVTGLIVQDRQGVLRSC